MPGRFDPAAFRRQIREAERRANADIKRQVDKINRENQRQVDEYNRKARQHNERVLRAYNSDVARVNEHNRRVDAQNRTTIAELNRRLRATGPVRYTDAEQAMADRVQRAVSEQDARQYDVFLSYARIDGADVGNALRERLEYLDVRVWFDEVAIRPGESQARQMDLGLAKARCGVALLTPAYLAGRFWTERELGALLLKQTLIPVLHGVTFEQVAEYSGILPDLAGFETRRDSVEVIAEKIAAAVLTA